ncbi:class I SAM-dependent methyltransferase [Sediminibacterium ginsengisoli]|uniref:Lysine methyltransferase n=1 Tax=Sediminibacterium ginsengisoli TaxID=413434 RepID=A0A1T4MBR4_9BACT|nr:methyltransferase domain-containing protein [Sediminibacterium ginsengisoli]SJZ64433.1 Lysine methyltransferase [Sediminibacterium ginsengisoli]
MMYPVKNVCFTWQDKTVNLLVPDEEEVRLIYNRDPSAAFPYWARLWPSAYALSRFIVENNEYVAGKRVLELAAGVGLPSMVAALSASEVCCSDYLPEAVELMQRSTQLNRFNNVRCELLNWHHLPETTRADVLLLSDINYDPAEFEVLYGVLAKFLNNGTPILLTTPQRLMARPFIAKLLPLCTRNEELVIQQDGSEDVRISCLVLQ